MGKLSKQQKDDILETYRFLVDKGLERFNENLKETLDNEDVITIISDCEYELRENSFKKLNLKLEELTNG